MTVITDSVRRAGSALVVFLLFAGLFVFSFGTLNYGFRWDAIWEYRQKFVDGWLVTVAVSAVSLVTSLLFGVAAALLRRSRNRILRYLSIVYVETIRGTPLLVQILIFFYVVADAFGVSNRYLVGVLTLSLFAGAYLAEMIRGAMESVGRSQMETAEALGLTPAQIHRLVIFPQVIRQLLPPLAGQFASIIKDSSLLSVIAVGEFTLNAQEVNAYTYSTLESYLPLAFGYLILTFPISLLSKRLERYVSYAT